MVRLDRIYTRRGDKGTTALIGGRSISKGHLKIEAYGTADELNAVLGLIHSLAQSRSDLPDKVRQETQVVLQAIQNHLFDIGSILAAPAGQTYPNMPQIEPQHVTFLEQRIDAYQEILEPLKSFVLPGGGLLAAYAHQARTVCRRFERILVRLAEAEPVPEQMLIYVNRLSDYLFVYSRWVNKLLNEPETLWQPASSLPQRPDLDMPKTGTPEA